MKYLVNIQHKILIIFMNIYYKKKILIFTLFKVNINYGKYYFINNYDSIVKCLDRENVDLRCSTYCLYAQTNYSKLKNNIKKIYNSIC